jgi:hypothetical protein
VDTTKVGGKTEQIEVRISDLNLQPSAFIKSVLIATETIATPS